MASKSVIKHRVQEVLRLTLAGAEFPEIRQHAKQQGWEVSDRQIRRYMEAAYRQFTKLTIHDAEQLVSRHIMQRRSLFARALKNGDLRTALAVLQDEAKLEGLYPPAKVAPTTPDGRQPYAPHCSIELQERLPRLVIAHANNDTAEMRLLEKAAPRLVYAAPDTAVPLQRLNTMALIYVNEQLEQAGQLLHAFWMINLEGDPDGRWNAIAAAAAYRFRIGKLAWEEFTAEIGVDGELLVRANYQGTLLDMCAENICNLAPARGQLQAACGVDVNTCVADLVESWRQLNNGRWGSIDS
jgi:hypothetical protein